MDWLRSVGRRIRGFLHLEAAHRRAFLWSAMRLPITRIGLRRNGLGTVQTRLDTKRASVWTTPDEATVLESRKLGRVVHLAADHGFGESNCLPRSLVLWSLLRRRGLEAQLRIGVSVANDETPRFHAWVEHNGEVVNDSPDVASQYLPFEGAIGPRETGF